MAESGISGLAVASITVGGFLVWSAVANVKPVDLAKRVLGRQTTGAAVGPAFSAIQSPIRPVGATGGSVGSAAAGAAQAVVSGASATPLIAAARKYLGVKYVWGGVSPSGLDCSGLVIRSLRDIGVTGVPRFVTATFGTWAKGAGWVKISGDFRAGDVILRPGHMGIALGGGRLIHAPHTGTVVKEANIWRPSEWWGWRNPK